MKKRIAILLLGMSIFSFTFISYSYENKTCESVNLGEGFLKECLKNYYIIDNTNNGDYIIYNNKGNTVFKINYIKEKIAGKINIINYEGKYGKHIYSIILPYTSADSEYCGLTCDFDKEKETFKHYNIIKEHKKELGLYIDGKKVFDFALNKENYKYNGLDGFANENLIYAFNSLDDIIIGKKNITKIFLSDKIRLKLDNFIKKIEKKGYSKEKLLKKLKNLYVKYDGKKGYKAKLYKEVITYLYVEILIDKLKQVNKLEKINYNY